MATIFVQGFSRDLNDYGMAHATLFNDKGKEIKVKLTWTEQLLYSALGSMVAKRYLAVSGEDIPADFDFFLDLRTSSYHKD